MSFQYLFRRNKKYSSLLESHGDKNGHGDDTPGEKSSRDFADEEDQTRTYSDIPEIKHDDTRRERKRKGFFRSFRSTFFLNKFRSTYRKRKHSIYTELNEDYGEFDEPHFEVVFSPDSDGVPSAGDQSLENIMSLGKKNRVDEMTAERITLRKQDRSEKKKDRLKQKPSQFQKKKSTKKKVLKATTTTGKFIGRGVIYTGSAFQYLAPVTSVPPERTWKKWREKPSPRYRQSEYVFLY